MNSSENGTHSSPNGGYRTLVDNFPNGVLVLFDEALRYRIVGPESLPFSGRTASNLVNEPVDELFPEETVSRIEPELRATIEGTSRSFDVEYDGRTHHIETRPTSIEGEPYGILVTQDVTEERETARELEQQNERLDQYASMMSHDLRNPLSIALGRLELYRETGEESNLDAVEDALSRIDELTVDLTSLVRHGTPGNEHTEVSLTEIARDAWETIDSRSATLETEDCTIEGDDGQLQALFENLFRNAVGHGGSDVTVRVGPLADGFYVEDTGAGIPTEERERAFEHGYTTGYSGSGVGLTIVGRIADSHGFDVSLTESAEGGARFEFHESSDGG
ncbi:PAS domain-containing protein [Halorarum halophilum]|uniref:histidine kinase n=1 Tax=Halorarum halophilum TaxID=2743090 RepID=A0A7D5KTJ6_9EURY|nr:PAS domain-containing sensor histidine kinase [Halobaculum halophilum]QLG26360.1 PAS domain-containing protein [Halobaculum halophilum]